ncbi:MAG: homoserine kinase [Euryarchaeota archaeon RBG_19FT_COMBO_56_21]|nr:MAG: homoserine kinase [Euryarchaeota archaeon RBG_19FT_COMBO_56_21]
MSCDRAVVSSPATIANFGPGFDSFGLCLDKPRDGIVIRSLPKGRHEVKVLGKFSLPTTPEKNTASYAAMKLADLCGSPDAGFSMTVRKGMKPGSGLGSSAASSVGGAVAMAAILGVRDKGMILEASAMGEELVAGSRHFDNVSAALYGGFTVVSDQRTRKILRIRPPQFQIIVALPDISVETRVARSMLPSSVEMKDAVCNVGLASGMLHAMMTRNVRMIGSYLDDKLALPHRIKLIPGYSEVRDAAMEAGALGFSIGGSGPAVFAISQGNAQKIRKAMVSSFKSVGLKSDSFITVPGTGVKVEKLS